jgi:hypothetical protein
MRHAERGSQVGRHHQSGEDKGSRGNTSEEELVTGQEGRGLLCQYTGDGDWPSQQRLFMQNDRCRSRADAGYNDIFSASTEINILGERSTRLFGAMEDVVVEIQPSAPEFATNSKLTILFARLFNCAVRILRRRRSGTHVIRAVLRGRQCY